MRARIWSSSRTAKACPRVGADVLAIAGEVADHFVDAIDAERGEVIAQRAEIALGVREQAVVHVALDNLALDFQAAAADLQQGVQTPEQARFVAAVQKAETGAIDRDDADRSGLLGTAEQAVAALQQLAEIELQPAAHGADHVRLQFGIDEVLEIGKAVLGRHLEQALGVLAVPGKVGCDVVGGDRKGEHATFGVALRHHLDIGAIDHVHFRLQFAVGEIHLLAADHRHLATQILRAGPVEGEVGERRLGAPPRGDIQVVDELLNRLQNLARS